jgi:hypothetical protein
MRLFNDLIGAGKERRRHRGSNSTRRAQIDRERKACRFLKWQIGDFGALQNLTDVIPGTTIVVQQVNAVGHQRAILCAPSLSDALRRCQPTAGNSQAMR